MDRCEKRDSPMSYSDGKKGRQNNRSVQRLLQRKITGVCYLNRHEGNKL